jgi:HPt (histidine-containing phosphotransfer) domain-containing protein
MLHDLSLIKSMGDKDPSIVTTVVGLFVESIPVDINALNEAVENQDWKQVAFISHKLKSTIDTLNVNSLSETIRVLETEDLKESLAESAIQEHINKVTLVLNKVMLELQALLPEL